MYATVAYWMIFAGISGGLLAAVPGWIDWFAIPAGTRAKSVGLLHGKMKPRPCAVLLKHHFILMILASLRVTSSESL